MLDIHPSINYFLHISIQPSFKLNIRFVRFNLSPYKSNGRFENKMGWDGFVL
jgi:hypothetical protein